MDEMDEMKIESKSCDKCAPDWTKSGWLTSPYTWFFIIFSLLVIFVSIYFSNFNNAWYDSLNKPPGMIPDYAFSIVWGILYTGIIIAIIMATWPNSRVCIGSITVLYVAIMLMMLLWILLFNQFHQLIGAAVVIVLVIPLIAFLIWLIWPNKCEKRNWFVGYFPVVMFFLLLGWICVASYYAIYFAVTN